MAGGFKKRVEIEFKKPGHKDDAAVGIVRGRQRLPCCQQTG